MHHLFYLRHLLLTVQPLLHATATFPFQFCINPEGLFRSQNPVFFGVRLFDKHKPPFSSALNLGSICSLQCCSSWRKKQNGFIRTTFLSPISWFDILQWRLFLPDTINCLWIFFALFRGETKEEPESLKPKRPYWYRCWGNIAYFHLGINQLVTPCFTASVHVSVSSLEGGRFASFLFIYVSEQWLWTQIFTSFIYYS